MAEAVFFFYILILSNNYQEIFTITSIITTTRILRFIVFSCKLVILLSVNFTGISCFLEARSNIEKDVTVVMLPVSCISHRLLKNE